MIISMEKGDASAANNAPIEEPLQFGDDSVNKPKAPRHFDLLQSSKTKSLGRGYLFSKTNILRFADNKVDEDWVDKCIQNRILKIANYYQSKGQNVFLWIYISREDISDSKRLLAAQKAIHAADLCLDGLNVGHKLVFEPLNMSLRGIYD